MPMDGHMVDLSIARSAVNFSLSESLYLTAHELRRVRKHHGVRPQCPEYKQLGV